MSVIESVRFVSRRQKVSKNSKHWSNEKGPSSTTKIVQRGTILRGLTQPLNAYGYKYFSLLLLLFYPFVVPVDLSQQAKSTYSDSID
jgi:hypothetical protein